MCALTKSLTEGGEFFHKVTVKVENSLVGSKITGLARVTEMTDNMS